MARRSQTEVAVGCFIMWLCVCVCVYMKEMQDFLSFYRYASMAVCLVSVLVNVRECLTVALPIRAALNHS